MAEKEKISEKSGEKKEAEIKISEKALEDEKQKLLEMSQISIWLDHYDDIFSDFDPRQYSQRSLSDDFLVEAKKASREKTQNKLEVRFLIPEAQRDAKNESIIKKRLHEHFTKHAHLLRNDIKNIRNKALMMAFIGLIMMLSATYINTLGLNTFLERFIFVLLEPGGWFMTWFALDRWFYTTELNKTEYEFYEKMSKCEIIFSAY